MTNEAAIGYMILAAKSFGFDHEEIVALEMTMRRMMDRKTEEEAEDAYRSN